MKLTENQIQELYIFTKQHYVEWYDLQSELVDHLANDIEQIWKKEPQLSFELAKLKSFNKFGVFGFMDVVDKKANALGKRYYKLIWKEFIQFFTIPKILITIILFFTLLFFIRFVQYNTVAIGVLLIILFIFPMIHVIKNRIQLKRKEKRNIKKWMFEEYASNLGGLIVFIQLPFQLINIENTWSITDEYLFSAVFIMFSLIIYIAIYIIPHKVKKILTKEYPNYQLS